MLLQQDPSRPRQKKESDRWDTCFGGRADHDRNDGQSAHMGCHRNPILEVRKESCAGSRAFQCLPVYPPEYIPHVQGSPRRPESNCPYFVLDKSKTLILVAKNMTDPMCKTPIFRDLYLRSLGNGVRDHAKRLFRVFRERYPSLEGS
jgi:hypothetical protein